MEQTINTTAILLSLVVFQHHQVSKSNKERHDVRLLFLLELETCGAGKLEKREGNGSVFAPLLVPFHFFFHILDSLFFFFFHFHFLN